MASTALYDFAIVTHAAVDPKAPARVVESVSSSPQGKGLKALELYGRPENGEVILRFRFSFSVYSSALRALMAEVAKGIAGKLVEPALLPESERQKLAERLERCPAKVLDALERTGRGLDELAGQMGLDTRKREQPLIQVRFESIQAMLSEYSRYLSEGKMQVPVPRRFDVGTVLRAQFVAPGLSEPLEVLATVLDAVADARGVWARLEPGPAFKAFVAKEASRLRQGRPVRPSPKPEQRKETRYESCLAVHVRSYPDLVFEFASNISKGGLFVKTQSPLPLRTRVRLTLRLPNDDEVETEAEVVHSVSVADAQQRGTSPGVGLAFAAGNEAFDQRIAQLIEQYRTRRPKVMLLSNRLPSRRMLLLALESAGMEVKVFQAGGPQSAEQSLVGLTDGLFELDALILDIGFFECHALLWRLRELGGEADLRVVALADGGAEDLACLTTEAGAHEALPRDAAVDEVLARVQKVLGFG